MSNSGRSLPGGGKEAELLREWLRRAGDIDLAVVRGTATGLIATLLEERPRAQVIAVVDTATDRDSLRTSYPRLTVRLSSTLDVLETGSPGLVVLRSSGFEGRHTLNAEIGEAAARLRPGGRVLLASHLKRGANRQLEDIRRVFGNGEIVRRGGGGFRLLSATRVETSAALDATEVRSPQEEAHIAFDEFVLGRHFAFRTASTVFSKDRLDRGTRLLLEHLPPDLGLRILDLGCGCGAIGVVVASCHGEASVTMVDVSLRAVELARMNAVLNGVGDRATALVSDGARELASDARFDTVLTHFPLHIPRGDLARILTESRDRLVDGGRLFGVALRPYNVAAVVHDVFGNVKTIVETPATDVDAGYRVIEAVKWGASND